MMVAMDAPTPITPAGWYDDGHGRLRWWDGKRWTEYTAPLTPQAAARPVAPQRPQQPTELKEVKRSKLVWIIPVVLVVAALVGGLLGAAASSSFSDIDPLKRTYADFQAAERTGDCVALEQVTTRDFREDLTDDITDQFTCAAWRARLAAREGDPRWGMRFGPVAVLVVEERARDAAGLTSTQSVTYTLVRENGRWKLDERDDADSA